MVPCFEISWKSTFYHIVAKQGELGHQLRVKQYSVKFYVWFSFFIVLLFLHCGSCCLGRNLSNSNCVVFLWCLNGHYQLLNHFSVKGYLCYKTIFCQQIFKRKQIPRVWNFKTVGHCRIRKRIFSQQCQCSVRRWSKSILSPKAFKN